MAPITPALPQACRNALLPERRSRFEQILNVAHWERAGLGRLGAGRARMSYASGLFSPRALLDDHFEHPMNNLSRKEIWLRF
jgi:hypothetical protein